MKKRYPCLLLPQGRRREFSIFVFRHKNEREEKCQVLKENKQLSIDLHCSHPRVRCAVVVHTGYYLWLHEACVGHHMCNSCLPLSLSEQCTINDIHTQTMRKQRILTNFYYSDSIIWNQFQRIRYSGMNIATKVIFSQSINF